MTTRSPSLSQSDIPPAQQRLVLCKVPGMSGIPSAAKAFLAFHASGTIRCPVPPESLKSVLPHFQKIICPDVSLNQFFSVFNIQTGADIAIASHTGGQNSGAAQKIMIPDHSLILQAQIMRTAERDPPFCRHGQSAFPE